MLLVFDVGNTNIVIGGFDKTELKFEFRLKTEIEKTLDEYAVLLFGLISTKVSSPQSFSGCVISSVVPPLTGVMVALVRERLQLEPLVVGSGIKTGIAIRLSDPSQIGSDRVVNALAARKLFGQPALVVDFGTATSFDYVNKQGEYEGGVIAPGLLTSLDSLVRNTAKLPKIELAWPTSMIGKSTVSAMQVGALVGYVSLVDGLINRIEGEVGKIQFVIATGGLGGVIKGHSEKITAYDPHLTLKGLQIIAELNDLR